VWEFHDPVHSEALHGKRAIAEIDSLFLSQKLMIFEIGGRSVIK
jgi:hypothetical protein